jgi:hypothetical protein
MGEAHGSGLPKLREGQDSDLFPLWRFKSVTFHPLNPGKPKRILSYNHFASKRNGSKLGGFEKLLEFWWTWASSSASRLWSFAFSSLSKLISALRSKISSSHLASGTKNNKLVFGLPGKDF